MPDYDDYPIGPHHPDKAWRHLVYRGAEAALRGKGALVAPDRDDPAITVAQFDDFDTGYAAGWHQFAADDFEEQAE